MDMNAVAALEAARDAGIKISIDGDRLRLEAPEPPPADVVDRLSRHKPGILVLLRSTEGSWSAEDWHGFFDERAGIAEFDAGLQRPQAEARAFACCITEWLTRNPAPSAPGRCVGCGGADRPADPLLPFGTETSGHAWLHSACWSPWYQALTAEAIAALEQVGIAAPPPPDS